MSKRIKQLALVLAPIAVFAAAYAKKSGRQEQLGRDHEAGAGSAGG
jgi:hypothetical protein